MKKNMPAPHLNPLMEQLAIRLSTIKLCKSLVIPQAGEEADAKGNIQFLRFAAALLLFVVSQTAAAFEYVSVAEPAILYDANSLKANKLFVATRYLPLEQIVVLDNWVKVRDSGGKIFWIEKRNLSSKRYVVVMAETTTVRTNWDDSATVAFIAPRQLGLEWLGNAGAGWVKVRHRDGTSGYVKSKDVWGH